ncbi:hypothetical protein [Rugamonas rubra]|nr:hypothetical protein [Rugamonas rubra]
MINASRIFTASTTQKGIAMEVVYFSDELAARAPGFMFPLCEAPGGAWLSLNDVIKAIQRRETVTIRPASSSEMNRAEAFVALFEIGLILGEKMEALLDQDRPDVAVGKITRLREAIESCDPTPSELLDRKLEA